MEDNAAPASEARPAPAARRPARRILSRLVLGAAVVGAAAWGWKTLRFYAHNASTDDAQVEARISPVLPKVSGYVTAVLVDDNQAVTAGQPLVKIDDRELSARVESARAALENARAAVAVASAGTSVAKASALSARAQIEAAKVALRKASDDVDRLAPLRQKEEVSQMQFDAAVAARDAAKAHLEAAVAQADAASSQIEAASRQVGAAEAQVSQKKAALDEAELQLSWTSVTAPSAGIVSKKAVEPGQAVQAGQPLLAIVDPARPWVVANFKETQLKKMRVGQDAELEVDAYPGRPFPGRIESLAGATGAKFALLPPDDASGNFVKVVQRVPVKIVFTGSPDPARPLRAGMSVNAVVRLD